MDIEQLRTVTKFAALAPSVHNTQPWHFTADGHTIEVRAEVERLLHVLDPNARQLHISCGIAIEFARLAVRALGHDCVVRLLPHGTDGDPTLLATLTVGHPLPTTPAERRLIDAIPRRYTDRGPYDATLIAPSVLARMREAAAERGCWLRVLDRAGDRTTTAMLIAEAEDIETSDQEFREELAAWRRTSPACDGVPVQAAQPWDDGVVSDVRLRDFLGRGHPAPADMTTPPSVERDLLVLLGSDDDTPLGWLRTGRALALVLLNLTADGGTSQPLGPVVDVPATRSRLQRSLGLLGHPQVLLRVGYGHGAPTAGRRDVDDLLTVNGVT
jgi:hypothetical protein